MDERKMAKALKFLVAILLVLLLPAIGSAQSAYRFRNYSINDGLSQSSVSCIIQDKYHSLWIGTQDGLNRFDGTSFEVFTGDNTKGLESGYIKCFTLDPRGNLWVGTSNGLTVYDPKKETFNTYLIKGKDYLHIESMDIDREGNIWMSTLANGVYSFNLKTKTFTSYEEEFSSRRVKKVAVGPGGEIIVYSDDKGLLLYHPHQKKVEEIHFSAYVSPIVTAIQVLPDGKILLGTNQGIYDLNLKNKKVSSSKTFAKISNQLSKTAVTFIEKGENATWYIGTNSKGMLTFHEKGTSFWSVQDIFQKNALLNNEMNTIYKDYSGTYWVGTGRGFSGFDPTHQGILEVGPSGNLKQGLPAPSVWSIAEDEDENYVFLGTDEGISRYNKEKGYFDHYYRSATKISSGEVLQTAVLSMHVENEDRILAGCVDGLFVLTITPGNAYHYQKVDFIPKDLAELHSRIYSIQHYKEKQYFLTTKAGVLLVDFKKRKFKEFVYDPEDPDHSIRQGVCRMVYKDLNNTYWFATSVGGLNKLVEKDGELTIVPYEKNRILLNQLGDYISCMFQVNEDEYWLGTLGSGLLRFKPSTLSVKKFTTETGLPNNVIYSILPDKNNGLWMSTNKGIARMDRKSFEVVHYSEIHGLQSNEFNLGAYHLSKTGRMYFGGISGYNYFDPTTLSSGTQGVDVIFAKIKLDKNWIKPNEKNSIIQEHLAEIEHLDLSYRQRSFTVKFQPTNLSQPDLVNYKYILEGSDEGEVLIGKSTDLRFSSLSPGYYVLKVYGRVGEGPWSKTPAQMNIFIASPFWMKIWFWAVAAIVLALATLLFIRRRIEFERIKQVRLEMKIAERTSEIRQQNVQIENQRRQLQKEKEKVERQQKLLQIEKEKSERLLKNVIPESTAQELLDKGKASARAYKTVSVLFTDFVGFTKIADRTTPTDLVNKLDIFFTKFDEIIVRNNLEKIKTIGDAYMCAGGVPVRNNTNPIDACLAAIQIQDFMRQYAEVSKASGEEVWRLRLGINTGEVTAGVIGNERLAYDIWGATVNQAQRMEMLGEPGKVTITEHTLTFIEPYFQYTYVGQAQTKSRGVIEMYVVERIKPELSVNGEGIYPNERFRQIFNLHHYSSINYYKAERHIMGVLEKGLSDKLHYHGIWHTQDVVQAVERLALSEDVTDEGLFLLKSAATYHDAGFVEQYDKNEPVGARLAEEILPKYGYTEQHIDRIKELIYVTQIPHQPKNKLEEIMCDADLDYLGRDDFHTISDRLRRELREHGKINSDRLWDEIQIKFLSEHRYFTNTAITMRREKKLANLEEVKERYARNEYQD